MAQSRLSPAQLTDLIREFGNQLTTKLADGGSLRDLLNDNLGKHLTSVNVDSRTVDLVVEVLVWEFAVDVASKFPARLADKLKGRGETSVPSRPGGGDIGSNPQRVPHTPPPQIPKTPVDARK